jgi:high-affinity iron transporter
MAPNVFSVPIFFIVFRETLEAAIIISVLLGLVEQIVDGSSVANSESVPRVLSNEKDSEPGSVDEAKPVDKRTLVRKLRLQVMAWA